MTIKRTVNGVELELTRTEIDELRNMDDMSVYKFEVGKQYRTWEHTADEHSYANIIKRTSKTVTVEFLWWWNYDNAPAKQYQLKVRHGANGEYIYVKDFNKLMCEAFDIEEKILD